MLFALTAYALVLALIAASALVASTSAARKRSVSSNKQVRWVLLYVLCACGHLALNAGEAHA